MITQIRDQKLLIIEDNVAEAIYAQAEAAKAGFKDFVAVTNLADAQRYLPEAQLVASDLFFGAGNTQVTGFSERIAPLYQKFKETRFQKTKGLDVVLRAVEGCAETFGVTPQVYVEEFMAKVHTIPSVLKSARDALAGVNDSQKYREFLKIEQDIKEGRNLPLGIIVTEQAKEKGLSSVIVTSTNHHDLAFEPVRGLITVPYFDTLTAGRKNWQGAMDYFLRGEAK